MYYGRADGSRMEVKDDLVLARLHVQGAQDIVHTSQLSLLSVDGRCPLGIIDLREHEHAALVGVHLISQVVGFVAFDDRQGGTVLLDGFAELLAELLVGDSLMVQVYLTYAVDLLVGIVDIVDLVHKPRVALNIRILQGPEHKDSARAPSVHSARAG